MGPRTAIAVGVVLAAAWAAGPAAASQLIDRDGTNVQLRVDRQGRALVSYSKQGVHKSVLVWGAINARAPQQGTKQVEFQLRYGANAAHGFAGGCGRYDGPALAFVVAACKAADGSYWAVQEWAVPLPDLGFQPWLPAQRSLWMNVSHWSGPIAQLDAYGDWVYSGTFHSIFGRYTYGGVPVHGFATTNTGVPTDGFGRLIFLDTYGSVYGPGWTRENSFVSHNPTGVWCYGFYGFDPTKGGYVHPPGAVATRGPGVGSKYRLTAVGPGVTPDVAATVDDLGDFSASSADDVALRLRQWRLFSAFIGVDKQCRQGRALGAVNVQVDKSWFSADPGGDETTAFGLSSPLFFNARFAKAPPAGGGKLSSAKVVWVHHVGNGTTRFENSNVAVSADGLVASARFSLRGPNNKRYIGTWTATLVMNGLQVATGTVEASLAAGTIAQLTQPVINGVLAPGNTLTVSPGTYSFTPARITYQWFRFPVGGGNGANLGAATSYTFTPADIGSEIECWVTAFTADGRQVRGVAFRRP